METKQEILEAALGLLSCIEGYIDIVEVFQNDLYTNEAALGTFQKQAKALRLAYEDVQKQPPQKSLF